MHRLLGEAWDAAPLQSAGGDKKFFTIGWEGQTWCFTDAAVASEAAKLMDLYESSKKYPTYKVSITEVRAFSSLKAFTTNKLVKDKKAFYDARGEREKAATELRKKLDKLVGQTRLVTTSFGIGSAEYYGSASEGDLIYLTKGGSSSDPTYFLKDAASKETIGDYSGSDSELESWLTLLNNNTVPA